MMLTNATTLPVRLAHIKLRDQAGRPSANVPPAPEGMFDADPLEFVEIRGHWYRVEQVEAICTRLTAEQLRFTEDA
jgi:hypothetical protein